MTDEEKHLWYDFLKKLPMAVKKQHPIENYIVDFYIPQAKIVIEIDAPSTKVLKMRKRTPREMKY